MIFYSWLSISISSPTTRFLWFELCLLIGLLTLSVNPYKYLHSNRFVRTVAIVCWNHCKWMKAVQTCIFVLHSVRFMNLFGKREEKRKKRQFIINIIIMLMTKAIFYLWCKWWRFLCTIVYITFDLLNHCASGLMNELTMDGLMTWMEKSCKSIWKTRAMHALKPFRWFSQRVHALHKVQRIVNANRRHCG